MRQLTVAAQSVVEVKLMGFYSFYKKNWFCAIPQKLEKLVLKGENIFKFSNMCFKLETEEEKIIVGQRPVTYNLEDAEADESQGEIIEVKIANENNFLFLMDGVLIESLIFS